MTSAVKKFCIAILKIAAAAAFVFAVWFFAAVLANDELILPRPGEVLAITFSLLGKSSVYVALFYTMLRAIAAFAASLAVAAASVLLCGVWSAARPFVDGAVTFFRALPTVSVILTAIIAFPDGIVPAFVAFLVAFPIVYAAFSRETDCGRLSDVCKVYGVVPSKKIRYVLLPQISGALLPQTKDTLPLCVKIVIAGEVLAMPIRTGGLGVEMYEAKVNLQTANVLALTLLALAVCYVISGICALCGRKK